MRKQSVGLCIILLALVVGAPLCAQNVPTGTSDSEHGKQSLAVHLLRIINTTEMNYRDNHGQFAPWAILVDSPEFPYGKKLQINDGPVVTPGINPRWLANLHFSRGPEILPGWRLRLDLTDDGKGYDVLLEDTTDKCGYAALTDERGLIRQSKAIDCPI